MKYVLIAHWRNGDTEEIDEFDNLEEAERMAVEYRMAYMNPISIRKVK
jgi:hypothetical protein